MTLTLTLTLDEDNELPTWEETAELLQEILRIAAEAPPIAADKPRWAELHRRTERALTLVAERALVEQACMGACDGVCCCDSRSA